MKKESRLLVILIVIVMTIAKTILAQGSTWTSINGNYLANIAKVKISSNGYLFVLNEGGVFRSTDDGITWKYISQNLGSLNLSSRNVLEMSSKDEIFFATGNKIYKSTNYGNNWINLSDIGTSLVTIQSFYCDNLENYFAGCNNEEIYKSTDKGSSWQKKNNGIQLGSSIGIGSILSNSEGTLFATSWGDGVYKSNDGGDNWTKTNTGLSDKTVGGIFISPSGTLFILTQWDCFRSTNKGGSWTLLPRPQTDALYEMKFDNNGTIFIACQRGVALSTNNGDSWKNIAKYPNYYQTNSIEFNNKTATIYAGVLGSGFYKSNDEGNNWECHQSNFRNINQQYKTISINNNGDIFVGADLTIDQPNSTYITVGVIYRSTDNGENWIKKSSGLPITINNSTINKVFVSTKGDLYACYSTSIYRSTDNGDTWENINNGLDPNSNVRTIIEDNNGKLFIGVYGKGVYKSTNGGSDWIKMNNGLYNTDIYSIAINSNANLFVGTKVGGIYRSTDSGENWYDSNIGLTDYDIYKICINSKGDLFSLSGYALYKSTNEGINWNKLSASGIISGWSGNEIFITPNDILFYGEGDVLISRDNGNSWETDAYFQSVTRFAMNKQGYLFGLGSEGVKMRVQSTVTSVENEEVSLPHSFKLLQNYPNPFNPTTTINYSLPKYGFVSLKIYDILGKEIKTLINEYKSAGSYNIEFNANKLVSGVYLYRLQAGNFVQTRKMILLK